MKFKVTNHEMIGLIALFQALITAYAQVYEDVQDKLFQAIYEELLLDLQRKALIKKEKYSIKLSPVQALAFWIEFNQRASQTTQAGNTIQLMCNAIHQQIISK